MYHLYHKKDKRKKPYILLCIIRQAQAERICQKKDQMQRFKEKIQKLAGYNFADSIWISGSILSLLISGFWFHSFQRDCFISSQTIFLKHGIPPASLSLSKVFWNPFFFFLRKSRGHTLKLFFFSIFKLALKK